MLLTNQMNNLSSALVAAASPTKAEIEASAKWAKQSLVVANGCRREAAHKRGDKSKDKTMQVPLADKEERECELTAIVSSYNLGKLCEVRTQLSLLAIILLANSPDELLMTLLVSAGLRTDGKGPRGSRAVVCPVWSPRRVARLRDAAAQSNEAIRRLRQSSGAP